ncbi:uncharacterized protein ColSpa_01558 [Colletotrichum spaethianum]|uniref:Uncharacterized protein n=1 Tax=Colletotrichum spaethianum TaxID=700344 RepID=A0AA37NTW3_9PEZI|nr:uncharacterized protein ColSpa_01558 [Colletotrichum spaethianum]GKT41377.1 hypothetical protein ColSpa_01558 [Colletotrichum spaethianum]
MQLHAAPYDHYDDSSDDTAFPVSNAVFRLSRSGGAFETGGPVISRVSRVKTATAYIDRFSRCDARVSVPVNTLIAVIAGTVGGILLLIFVIAVVQAFLRRRHIIYDETHSAGGVGSTLEKGSPPGGQEQHHAKKSNVGSIGITHPSPSAHSELGISQQYQAANFMSDPDFPTWPAAHDTHPGHVVAELPAESYAEHSQHGYRG